MVHSSDVSPTCSPRRRPAVVALLLAVAAILLVAAQPASAGSVSGTFGTPGDATLQYTIAGADNIALKPGSTNRYSGVYSGGPITISGTITITRAVGHVSAVSMSADIAGTVSYTHLRAHETVLDLVCRLLLEKKKLDQHITLQKVTCITYYPTTPV